MTSLSNQSGFLSGLISSPAGRAAGGLDERGRATLILIGVFWAFTFAVLSVRSAVSDILPFQILGLRRFWVALFGALLCLGMAKILDALRSRSFAERIVWGVAGALVMSIAHTAFAMSLNRLWLPVPGAVPITFSESVQWVILLLGYFLAWTGTHLALTYHWEVGQHQARVSAMTELTQEAHIAALRYQIGPHFLFNTLNSISSLVLERKNDEAEKMLLNLSTFLRSTLATDSSGTIDLREEIELQRLYLAIEEVRFEERMSVAVEIPPELQKARVPALILQPLVENAIRHGVSRSEETTRIGIVAAQADNRLHLAVHDMGAAREFARPGTGLGLANVRQRLRVHYGDRGRVEAEDLDGRGFRAAVSLPLEYAE